MAYLTLLFKANGMSIATITVSRVAPEVHMQENYMPLLRDT